MTIIAKPDANALAGYGMSNGFKLYFSYLLRVSAGSFNDNRSVSVQIILKEHAGPR